MRGGGARKPPGSKKLHLGLSHGFVCRDTFLDWRGGYGREQGQQQSNLMDGGPDYAVYYAIDGGERAVEDF